MAGSQDDGNHPYEPMLEDFFDLEAACAEDPVRRESVHGAEPQAPDHPRLPDHRATLESRQEQNFSTETRVGSFLEPLLQPTVAGMEPQYRHEQIPQTKHQIEELQDLDDELEKIEFRKLELRRNQLLKRRRGLLQESALPQQGQTSERSGLEYAQDNIIMNDSTNSVATRSDSFNYTSQSGVAFVSSILRKA